MITQRDYDGAIQPLLTAINHLAPTREVQTAFVRLLHEMQEEGRDPHAIVQSLVGTLYDGLAHGNWIPLGKDHERSRATEISS